MLRHADAAVKGASPTLEHKSDVGAVRLDVLALVAVVAYFYEFSVDQTTWLPGIQTGRTDGTISGLKAGTVYYFRFRCLKTDDTYTDYSNVVHLLVQ